MSPHGSSRSASGISAESGLKTSRDSDGLWEGHKVEEVATPRAFAVDPEMVHQFYNMRRSQLLAVEPNLAYHALVRLKRRFKDHLTLVTQMWPISTSGQAYAM